MNVELKPLPEVSPDASPVIKPLGHVTPVSSDAFLLPKSGNKPVVVIVGGGIGGVSTALQLQQYAQLFDIVLIDSNETYIFKPRLYEWLNGTRTCLPLAYLFSAESPIHYLLAKVLSISTHPGQKVIKTSQGLIHYDYLILSPGASTAYFNIEGARENTMPLNTLYDIVRIKNYALEKLRQAAALPKDSPLRRDLLTFQIVGGGPTGVELALELKIFLQKLITETYHTLIFDPVRIQLIEGGATILPGFTDSFRRYVMTILREHGIELLLQHQVKRVGDAELLVLAKDRAVPEEIRIPNHVPIWVAGIRSNLTEDILPDAERLPNGRVCVNTYLQLAQSDDVYVIGDAAAAKDAKTQALLPPTGQVVEGQAAYVVRDLLWKETRKTTNREAFIFQEKGKMVSLGPGKAVVSLETLPGPLKGFLVKGHLGALIRNTYYGQKLKQFN